MVGFSKLSWSHSKPFLIFQKDPVDEDGLRIWKRYRRDRSPVDFGRTPGPVCKVVPRVRGNRGNANL